MRTLAFLALVACDGGETNAIGYDMAEHVPLDGTRSWVYTTFEGGERLDVVKASEEAIGDDTVVTLEYFDGDGALLYDIKWASDDRTGVSIYGWASADGATTVNYDPPVKLARYRMNPGDSVETSTDGTDWKSTFQAHTECENNWVASEDTWSCAKVLIEGDNTAPFTGTWYFAPRWGASRWQHVDATEPWVLNEAEWTREEDT